MIKNILYIPGFKSGPTSTTFKALKSTLPECNVYCIQNSLYPERVLKQIDDAIKKYNIDCLIASSLGGFYALQYKNMLKIVMNPCLNPEKEVVKLDHAIPAEILPTFKKLQANLFSNIDNEVRAVTYGIFGRNDELFSYAKEFGAHFNNMYWTGDKHRISPQTVNTLVRTLIVDTIPDKIRPLMYESISLNERYVNIFDKEEARKHMDEIWPILQKSYAPIGGILGVNTPEDLLNDIDMWKLVKRNGKICVVFGYSFKRGGRKCTVMGYDDSIYENAWKDLNKTIEEDIKQIDRHAWYEVSHKPEEKLAKRGAIPIPNHMIPLIFPDKEIVAFDSDGFHYTRKIGNQYVTKICYGNFQPNPKK